MCVSMRLCDYSKCSGLNKLEGNLADCVSDQVEKIYGFFKHTKKLFSSVHTVSIVIERCRENGVQRVLPVLMSLQAICK